MKEDFEAFGKFEDEIENQGKTIHEDFEASCEFEDEIEHQSKTIHEDFEASYEFEDEIEHRGKKKAIKVLKIIGTVIYAIVAVFLLVLFLTSYPTIEDGWDRLGYVLGVIIYSIIALCIYAIPIIMGIVGTILSKKAEDKKSIIYFIFMIVLPIVTVVLFFCSAYLVAE